ncbi:MAG: TetR/AcrR family transcriptional regulator [Deltaproteobacteria bacterium]|nr:TetR/AcrR family transcriptional regulator [Deltaproteobacteria bacterium]
MARPRSDIRPRLLESARARFLADGVDGASLRAIARAAKTSLGMVHYYFGNKEELFFAVVEETYAELLSGMKQAVEGATTLPERIERVSMRIAEASDTELDILRIVLRESLASSDRRTRLMARFRRGHLALVLGLIEEGASQGEVRRDVPSPALVPMVLAVTLLPQLIKRLAGPAWPFAASLGDARTIARLSADVLLHGIAVATPPKDE